MAPRTTEVDVKAIISTSLTTIQINTFIADAALWIDEELLDEGYSTPRLELIERYLACALIRLRDLGLKTAKFDDMAERYQVDDEMTEYLTRAAAFDSSGTIRRYFLAPADLRQAQYRVGARYVDDTP